MRNLLLITNILLLGAIHCFANGDYNALWQKGNDFYQQKQYDSAAFYYEQIAILKPGNATIFYNLGNTYYRLNKIGPAVLNYERALKINPDHKEAKENLVLTQARISNHIRPTPDIFFIRWWNALTRPDKAPTWSVCSLATFALIMLVLFLRKFSTSVGKYIPSMVTGFLILILCCCLLIAFTATRKSLLPTGAVVMQNDAALMNASLKGKPVMLVPEGTPVKIKSENGVWIEVSLPDGRSGWLRLEFVTKI